MIVGALQVATNGGISTEVSFIINIIPVLAFVIICYVAKSQTQVRLHILIPDCVQYFNIYIMEIPMGGV